MYLCYGDDSVNDNIIAYALVGTKNDIIEQLIEKIKSLKSYYSLPLNKVLHCRILFSGSLREKDEHFRNLSLEQIKSLYSDLLKLIIEFNLPQPLVGLADNRNIKYNFPKTNNYPIDTKYEERHYLWLLKNSCLLKLYELLDSNEENYKFYSDKISNQDCIPKNSTKIQGLRRRTQWKPAFISSELTRKSDSIKLKEENYENAPYKEMYEIADFVAYVSSKAKCEQKYQEKDFFLELFHYMNPIEIQLLY